jgi:hypothetical protein
VAWPAERFYWSVLEAPQWKRRGPLPEGLKVFLEEDVPVSAEGLHAVCAPMGDGRVLVCAADADSLASLEPGTITLVPETLPDFAGGALAPSALNLLVGAFEPRAVRRGRNRRQLAAAAAVLVTAGLAAVGFSRRAAVWEQASHDASAATDQVLATALPGATPESLAMDVMRAKRLAEAASQLRPPPDAALALGAVLRAWPSGVSSKPQSLLVSESGATVSVTVQGDATPFLKAMKPPAGWTQDEPRLNSADSLTRLTLQLRPPGAQGAMP